MSSVSSATLGIQQGLAIGRWRPASAEQSGGRGAVPRATKDFPWPPGIGGWPGNVGVFSSRRRAQACLVAAPPIAGTRRQRRTAHPRRELLDLRPARRWQEPSRLRRRQRAIGPRPRAVVPPHGEVAPDRRTRREILRDPTAGSMIPGRSRHRAQTRPPHRLASARDYPECRNSHFAPNRSDEGARSPGRDGRILPPPPVTPRCRPPTPIGVGKGFRPPRPPNRTCGFPAYGSPVGGFLIGDVSLPARPGTGRTARRLRRRHSSSVDGRPGSVRGPVASPACAAARAAVCG